MALHSKFEETHLQNGRKWISHVSSNLQPDSLWAYPSLDWTFNETDIFFEFDADGPADGLTIRDEGVKETHCKNNDVSIGK